MSTVMPDDPDYHKRIGYDFAQGFIRFYMNTCTAKPLWMLNCNTARGHRYNRRMKRRYGYKQRMREYRNPPTKEPGDTAYFWNNDWMKVAE
jgi:hypothetical protein